MTNDQRQQELRQAYHAASRLRETITDPHGQVTVHNEWSDTKRKLDDFLKWLRENPDKLNEDYNPLLFN